MGAGNCLASSSPGKRRNALAWGPCQSVRALAVADFNSLNSAPGKMRPQGSRDPVGARPSTLAARDQGTIARDGEDEGPPRCGCAATSLHATPGKTCHPGHKGPKWRTGDLDPLCNQENTCPLTLAHPIWKFPRHWRGRAPMTPDLFTGSCSIWSKRALSPASDFIAYAHLFLAFRFHQSGKPQRQIIKAHYQ